jgi:hypothetical protein
MTDQVSEEEHRSEALTDSSVATLRDYTDLVRAVYAFTVLLRSLVTLDEDIRPWIKSAASLIAAEALKVEAEY